MAHTSRILSSGYGGHSHESGRALHTDLAWLHRDLARALNQAWRLVSLERIYLFSSPESSRKYFRGDAPFKGKTGKRLVQWVLSGGCGGAGAGPTNLSPA